MYYGRVLISARFVPDEEKSSKTISPTADAMLPDHKTYTVWFDVYELNSENLSKSDKYWIEIQVGDYIYPDRQTLNEGESNFFSKYSDPLKKYVWKERRYKPFKEVILIHNKL